MPPKGAKGQSQEERMAAKAALNVKIQEFVAQNKFTKDAFKSFFSEKELQSLWMNLI